MVQRVTDLRSVEGGYAALDDRMLVLDFQAGHPEAFVEIHGRYGGLVRHVCRRFLPNAADADEAFQESMIRVFQGLYRFNGRYALQPWVARIATNVSLDLIRSRSRRPPTEEAPIEDHERPDTTDGPEELYERLVERDLVLSVLAGLPETHRRALVLRELEGASHKEIAEDMGMSPAQAKALIHRAKGSFRRRWMEKMSERSGLAGFALLPLVWALRLADSLRRVLDRAGYAAVQAATPELVSSTTATATPHAYSLAERVVAAGVTLIVAGGVTVGAATLVRHRADHQREAVVVAAPAPTGAPASVPPVREQQPSKITREVPRNDQGPHAQPPVLVDPTIAPGTEPSPSTDPTPTPSPSPDPSPSPAPVFPPAPAWTGSFRFDWASDDDCGCAGGVSLALASSTGQLSKDSDLTVHQVMQGAALDAEGDPAWLVSADYVATLGAKGGDLQLVFALGSDKDSHVFTTKMDPATVSGAPGDGNPVLYTFYGSYSMTQGDPNTSPVPLEGVVAVQIGVWSDGTTAYTAQFLLHR